MYLVCVLSDFNSCLLGKVKYCIPLFSLVFVWDLIVLSPVVILLSLNSRSMKVILGNKKIKNQIEVPVLLTYSIYMPDGCHNWFYPT